MTTGDVERGKPRVGGLCYSGVRIPSDMVATVNATIVEFVKHSSLQ